MFIFNCSVSGLRVLLLLFSNDKLGSLQLPIQWRAGCPWFNRTCPSWISSAARDWRARFQRATEVCIIDGIGRKTALNTNDSMRFIQPQFTSHTWNSPSIALHCMTSSLSTSSSASAAFRPIIILLINLFVPVQSQTWDAGQIVKF